MDRSCKSRLHFLSCKIDVLWSRDHRERSMPEFPHRLVSQGIPPLTGGLGAWRTAWTFFGNSHRISFCVLNSPKSARRRGLCRPPTAEISEIAFKRVLGAKKRKSRKGPGLTPGRDRRMQIVGRHGNVISATSNNAVYVEQRRLKPTTMVEFSGPGVGYLRSAPQSRRQGVHAK